MFSMSQGGHFTGGYSEGHQLSPEIALSNKFPGKLWRLVNSCKTGAIKWGSAGNTIIMHQTQFQKEFLDPPNTMFKTTNIGSFIRQLNLYGFRKLNVVRFAEATADMREVHEFQNDFFHRGRPDLLSYLKRNVGIRRTRDLAVKRRLESMDCGSSAKHARYSTQPMTYAPPFLSRHHTSMGGTGFPGPSLMYQSAGNGKWPVYMHWDKSCGVCKYVVLPDTGSNTLPSSINGNPVVYSPVQGPDGRYYPVVKLPGEKQDDPPQEYYLVKILPEAFQQENFPKEIIPCYPAEPGEYNKILGGGDGAWSYQTEGAAVPKHTHSLDGKPAQGRRGPLTGDVPDRSGDASFPGDSSKKSREAAGLSVGYPLHRMETRRRSLDNHAQRYYSNDNDGDSDSEFSSSESEDADSTVCGNPPITAFNIEPRVLCEGGRTVGLNELVQMAAKVLTPAQAQEVVNIYTKAQQPTKSPGTTTMRKVLDKTIETNKCATVSAEAQTNIGTTRYTMMGHVAQRKSAKGANSILDTYLNAGADVSTSGEQTPMMDPSMIKQETLSPEVSKGLLDAPLVGVTDTFPPGPWTMVGGMTVMENSKVKVEMMETCSHIAGFSVPASLAADA